MTATHQHQVGDRVSVYCARGFGDGGAWIPSTGWRVGTVMAQTTIGEARVPGGFPTYTIETRLGTFTSCAAECVRAR